MKTWKRTFKTDLKGLNLAGFKMNPHVFDSYNMIKSAIGKATIIDLETVEVEFMDFVPEWLEYNLLTLTQQIGDNNILLGLAIEIKKESDENAKPKL